MLTKTSRRKALLPPQKVSIEEYFRAEDKSIFDILPRLKAGGFL